jgi:O-antigen ligase
MTVGVIVVQRLALPFFVPRSITIGVFIFAVGGLLSSLEAVSPYGSAMIVVRMLYLTIVWFWLGTVVLRTRAHVETALAAWVVSAAISSSGAVLQFFYGDVIPGGIVNYGRMSGFTTQLNVLGGLAATAFVPALMLALDSSRPRMRILGLCSTGLITAGLLLSGSVGGLLAASGATLLWLVLRGIGLRIVLALGAVIAVGFILMSATGTTDSPSPVKRILNVSSREEEQTGRGGTVYTRLEGYSDAWARIQQQPLIGVGLDYDSTLSVTPKAVHNMILGPWLTAGILGVVGLMVIVGGSIATGVRVLRRSPSRFRSFDAATFAALIAFVQFSMGEPILYVRYGWFPTALLLALWAQQLRSDAYRRETAARRDRASPWHAGVPPGPVEAGT